MPVQPWTGVRSATAFGAMCPQKSNPIAPDARDTSKENCLYLNVWTPDWPRNAPTPVMVWIPGGGNFAGSSSDPLFDGERLARRGVVVVTINYRLGPFGFFSHPALTRESPHHASGNQGILDQIAALTWVRDNIAAFGGDPNTVTIFGESAGSLDVSVLMTSPLSKGLFRRVIGESGSVVLVGDPLPLPQAEQRGKATASRWKIPADASLSALRAVSKTDILDAEPDFFTRGDDIATLFPNLGVTVDGYVFLDKPREVFAAGREHKVALLHGNNSREQIPGATLPTDITKATSEGYGPLARRAQALYVGSPDPIYGTVLEQWGTDTSFRCSAVSQLTWHARAGNPSFEYEFTRVAPGREPMGSTHAAELSHVFGAFDNGVVGVGPPARATEVDSRVSEVMQRYWTNFAKTGDPNGSQLPKWPKFDTSSRAYMQFTDVGPIAKEGLRRTYCELFLENVRRLSAK